MWFQKRIFLEVLKLEQKMKTIERTEYLERMRRLKGTRDIKVITGVRRSGKSELMKAFIELLKKEEPDSNIIYLDLLLHENESLRDKDSLYEKVEKSYRENKANYLLIDEVQLCKRFEEAINWIYAEKKYDIYLTGSNAFMLSSDLATYFTGRQIEIHVLPFSFKEFCAYHDEEKDINRLFERYSTEGGISGSYEYGTPVDKASYINSVFNTILTRDIVQRYRLTNLPLLSNLTDYLMGNMSELTSVNNITNKLKAEKNDTNHVTIGNYIRYLGDSFLFYDVKRYDIRGKKYLETADKYYLVDQSFRYSRLGTINMDYGKLYENIVAMELIRRGYEIYVGKLYEKEIDFVVKKQNEKLYIQVSDNISNPETLERELSPLRSIRDSYPKILIARTGHEVYDKEGLRIHDIARWLAENDR